METYSTLAQQRARRLGNGCDHTQFTSAVVEAADQAGREGTKRGVIHMGEAFGFIARKRPETRVSGL